MKSIQAWQERNHKLEAENASLRTQLDNANKAGFAAGELANRLAAELEALRPKPVVRVMEARLAYAPHEDGFAAMFLPGPKNIKLTFHDGALVKADVIGESK